MILAAGILPSSKIAAGVTAGMELHRAGGGALETTVDQALIRGLGTVLPCFVSGLFRCLEGGRRAGPGHVARSGVPLRGSASSAVQSNAVGLRQPVQVNGSIWCAMAQRNAAISRAIAAMTTGVFLPAAVRRRYRAQSRIWAFQAMSRTAFGSPSSRGRRVSLTRAG